MELLFTYSVLCVAFVSRFWQASQKLDYPRTAGCHFCSSQHQLLPLVMFMGTCIGEKKAMMT